MWRLLLHLFKFARSPMSAFLPASILPALVSEVNAITMKSWNLFAAGGRLRYPGFPAVAYVSMEVGAGVVAASGLLSVVASVGVPSQLPVSTASLQAAAHRASICFACLLHRTTRPPHVRSSLMCMPCVLAASQQTSSW